MNVELRHTANMMTSDDYKERFRAEYLQTRIRFDKLAKMIIRWDEGNLDFTPTCPRSLYDLQLRAMKDYLAILEARAKIENVNLYYNPHEIKSPLYRLNLVNWEWWSRLNELDIQPQDGKLKFTNAIRNDLLAFIRSSLLDIGEKDIKTIEVTDEDEESLLLRVTDLKCYANHIAKKAKCNGRESEIIDELKSVILDAAKLVYSECKKIAIWDDAK